MNHSAIRDDLDMYGIENKKWMLEQILFCYEIERELQEKEREKGTVE